MRNEETSKSKIENLSLSEQDRPPQGAAVRSRNEKDLQNYIFALMKGLKVAWNYYDTHSHSNISIAIWLKCVTYGGNGNISKLQMIAQELSWE